MSYAGNVRFADHTTVHQSKQYKNCVVCDNCGAVWTPDSVMAVNWKVFGVGHTLPGSIDLRTTCPGCGLRFER